MATSNLTSENENPIKISKKMSDTGVEIYEAVFGAYDPLMIIEAVYTAMESVRRAEMDETHHQERHPVI